MWFPTVLLRRLKFWGSGWLKFTQLISVIGDFGLISSPEPVSQRGNNASKCRERSCHVAFLKLYENLHVIQENFPVMSINGLIWNAFWKVSMAELVRGGLWGWQNSGQTISTHACACVCTRVCKCSQVLSVMSESLHLSLNISDMTLGKSLFFSGPNFSFRGIVGSVNKLIFRKV